MAILTDQTIQPMKITYPRSLFVVLIPVSLISNGSAQCTGGWAREGGGLETDFGRSVAVDMEGNVYVTGSFTGAAEFSGVEITSSDDAEDIFLAKYAADGSLLWIRSGGGQNIDWPGKVAVDGEGNAYITGTHFRPALFGGLALANAANQPNAFVVKYDQFGGVLWAISLGGNGWDSGDAIAYDAVSGHVIVGGQFEGTSEFGDLSATATSQRDMYLAEVDIAGIVVGLGVLGQATGNEQVRGLTTDASGSVYAVGMMDGSVTIGTPYAAAGAQDCMLLKFAPGLQLEWGRFGGGIADDSWNDVAVGSEGEVFASGVASGDVVFGAEMVTGAGDKDQVLAKYSADGDLEWVQHGGGTGIDAGSAVVALGNGHALFTGSFQGIATFSGTTVTASGEEDVLLVECDATGAALNITHWGMEGDNNGYGLARGTNGAVYLTGQFEGGMIIGDTVLQSAGGRDAFVHQVCDGSVGVADIPGNTGFALSPNPVAAGSPCTLSFQHYSGAGTLLVCEAQGRTMRSHQFAITPVKFFVDNFAKGVYGVRFIDQQGRSCSRMLVVE